MFADPVVPNTAITQISLSTCGMNCDATGDVQVSINNQALGSFSSVGGCNCGGASNTIDETFPNGLADYAFGNSNRISFSGASWVTAGFTVRLCYSTISVN